MENIVTPDSFNSRKCYYRIEIDHSPEEIQLIDGKTFYTLRALGGDSKLVEEKGRWYIQSNQPGYTVEILLPETPEELRLQYLSDYQSDRGLNCKYSGNANIKGVIVEKTFRLPQTREDQEAIAYCEALEDIYRHETIEHLKKSLAIN